jgi:hypothetical protein
MQCALEPQHVRAQVRAREPKPYTLKPKPYTLKPKPYTLKPKPET